MSTPIALASAGVGSDYLIESFAWGLRELGYDAQVHKGLIEPGAINILFAGMKLDYRHLLEQCPRVINYNLDFVGSERRVSISPENFALMRNIPNWDYSAHNVEALKRAGVSDVTLVPFGPAPTMVRVPEADKDIDVIFYGSMSPRRLHLLELIEARGLNVLWTTDGFWTEEERDHYIARAKLVLEMPFYDSVRLFSEARASYLFANRAAVIAELNADTIIADDLRDAVLGAPYDQIPALCAEYCADSVKRDELATRGHEAFAKRDWLTPLSNAMADYIAHNPVRSVARNVPTPIPRVVNLGAGRAWQFDQFNVDIDRTTGADWVLDLNLPIAFGETRECWRFGPVRLEAGGAERIVARHVLECTRDLVQAMTNCLDWLAPGGTLDILVAYDLSEAAWSDPGFIRSFNMQSFTAFTTEFWRAGWRDWRFELISQTLVVNEIGRALMADGASAESVSTIPRAVDGLHLQLCKIAVTPEERATHWEYLRDVFR